LNKAHEYEVIIYISDQCYAYSNFR